MDAEFWSRIDGSRPGDGDPEVHAEALVESLASAGLEATRGFAEAFDRAHDALYRWDLWGAAFLALGGCSDDAFADVRAWIIGRGEAAWGAARTDAEAFFLALVDGSDDPEARLLELGLHRGEALLLAPGLAHEQLTGDWRPVRAAPGPASPVGDEWDEDDLESRFPRLARLFPPESDLEFLFAFDDDAPPVDDFHMDVLTGLAVFASGDHDGARELLEPMVDDDESWARVGPEEQLDVAYVVGAVRLAEGRVDEAAAALHRVSDRLAEAPPVRRALAQIELARGDLEAAGRWIDDGPDAVRMDRVLAAKLAWRRGLGAEAVALATREADVAAAPGEHEWDVAGALYQLGSIFVEAGAGPLAEEAVRALPGLLAHAPEELPLVLHMKILLAGVTRLQGRFTDALAQLQPLCEVATGSERGECFRERARCLTALGRTAEAGVAYRTAVDAFRAAGERWEAAATETEGTDRGN